MSDTSFSLVGSNLSKSFVGGGTVTPAVRDVSVSVPAGQLCLVMGPSGCGKSSLLAMLSGLLHPDKGRVVALGQDVWSMTEQERRQFRLSSCGFIFQAYNLFPALTAREQLEMVLRWGEGMPFRQARYEVSEMLDFLGLAGKENKLPIQLSGGEKQRVAVGRALIKKPKLCFADEPTSALDWKHGQQVIEILRERTRQQGATVLVVSHDHRLMRYADQVVYLDDGCLSTMPADEAAEFPSTPLTTRP